ncbi:flagellar biosynthesis repressor FlbT [Rhodoplanes sp. SY1]|uniref:flagellar biosynthesis repressor FlbT n=1 Tax=Rhodoplanes sp. SY1 TaxID=3166646 RepID=UPI0038B68D7D
MPLTLEVRPREKIILGQYVLASAERTKLTFFSDDVIILREKDLMRLDEAVTEVRRLYYDIQMEYIGGGESASGELLKKIGSMEAALPGARSDLILIAEYVRSGLWYKALKSARRLIEQDREASRVKRLVCE